MFAGNPLPTACRHAETTFLKHLHDSLLGKAERNLLKNGEYALPFTSQPSVQPECDLKFCLPPTVESCSMDTLRNAVKSMVDLGMVGYKGGTRLHLTDSNRLMEVVQKVTDFKS